MNEWEISSLMFKYNSGQTPHRFKQLWPFTWKCTLKVFRFKWKTMYEAFIIRAEKNFHRCEWLRSPIQKKLHPCERLRSSVQNKITSVQGAWVIPSEKICIRVSGKSYLFRKIAHPCERLESTVQPFSFTRFIRLSYGIQFPYPFGSRVFYPFNRKPLVYVFRMRGHNYSNQNTW